MSTDLASDLAAAAWHSRVPLRFALHDEEDQLYLDYGGSGVWLPWYASTRVRQNVDFSWSATVGFRPDGGGR